MTRETGFTLIETVVFIIVVSVGLTGVVLMFTQTAGNSHEPLLREKALTVAKATMDEICSRRWDENTPLGGGCVETASAACSTYCGGLDDAQCVASKCQLVGPGNCQPSASVSADPPPGPETGETRQNFDDVDDYKGLDVAPPEDDEGNELSGYDGDYRVTASVEKPATAWNGIPAEDVRRIIVTVAYDGGRIRLSSYRVNY